MDFSLDVRMDGYDDPIGTLEGNCFIYKFTYAENYEGRRLSLSMDDGRDKEVFNIIEIASSGVMGMRSGETFMSSGLFFENFVGFNSVIMDILPIRCDLYDIVGLLSDIGKDCPGAISVQPQGSSLARIPGNFETDYNRFEKEDIADRVKSFHMPRPRPRFSTRFHSPSPIAGIQDKVTLTVLPDGSFAQPVKDSGAPTTHILKVSNKKRLNETLLEESLMRMSKKFGIRTAEVENREIAGINTLLVTRYDREVNEDGHIIRLHQEDFAQAIGLKSAWKYEYYGAAVRFPDENSSSVVYHACRLYKEHWNPIIGPQPAYEYSGHSGYVFNVKSIAGILNHPDASSGMREEFINMTVFDLLTGNNENHAKNFSLLHKEDGKFEFAPRYDLVPARVFEGTTDRLAYSIGYAKTLKEITVNDFNLFLKTLGIEDPSKQKRLRDSIFLDLGRKFAGELDTLDKGLADLIATNICHLFKVFDLAIPDAVRGRDTFVINSDKVGTLLIGGGIYERMRLQ